MCRAEPRSSSGWGDARNRQVIDRPHGTHPATCGRRRHRLIPVARESSTRPLRLGFGEGSEHKVRGLSQEKLKATWTEHMDRFGHTRHQRRGGRHNAHRPCASMGCRPCRYTSTPTVRTKRSAVSRSATTSPATPYRAARIAPHRKPGTRSHGQSGSPPSFPVTRKNDQPRPDLDFNHNAPGSVNAPEVGAAQAGPVQAEAVMTPGCHGH